MKPSTAAILGAIGGAMYIVGGAAAATLIAALYGVDAGLSGNQAYVKAGVNDANFLVAFGFIVGIIIIALSVTMLKSTNKKMRQIGGVLVIIVALLGALNTFGGLIIGIILSIAGAVGAITYKG
jgi:small-conductance mechanosensitive channel